MELHLNDLHDRSEKPDVLGTWQNMIMPIMLLGAQGA
jgi:hypothetical protein